MPGTQFGHFVIFDMLFPFQGFFTLQHIFLGKFWSCELAAKGLLLTKEQIVHYACNLFQNIYTTIFHQIHLKVLTFLRYMCSFNTTLSFTHHVQHFFLFNINHQHNKLQHYTTVCGDFVTFKIGYKILLLMLFTCSSQAPVVHWMDNTIPPEGVHDCCMDCISPVGLDFENCIGSQFTQLVRIQSQVKLSFLNAHINFHFFQTCLTSAFQVITSCK